MHTPKTKKGMVIKMKHLWRKAAIIGSSLILAFIVWTILVLCVDVQPVGQNGTNIGFSSINTRFHAWTGEHLAIYTITDWLGLIPIVVCVCFGCLGLYQLIKRKSLKKVDADIILLGVYYALVILGYLIFEMIPINYRPILIEGRLEASYPSSTTLLVLSVMPTLLFEIYRRFRQAVVRYLTLVFVVLFSGFMVIGRLVSGVHWLTDILGAVLLSAGLYLLFRSAVLFADEKQRKAADLE